MTKGLDQYLQDAKQLCALEVNYFDDNTRLTNASLMSEMAEQVSETSQNNLPTAKQELARNIPESLKTDTGHTLQHQTAPKSTLQQGIDWDANHQQHQLQDQDEQDTIVHNADILHDNDDRTTIDPIADGTSTQPEKSITELLPTDDVTIPNKKLGCILVTRHLQQFLEGYLPPSDKQAFLDVYHMLPLLEKYLYDNPTQDTHCMSSDNEYVALLKYAIHLNKDLSMFPTVWAVLSWIPKMAILIMLNVCRKSTMDTTKVNLENIWRTWRRNQ